MNKLIKQLQHYMEYPEFSQYLFRLTATRFDLSMLKNEKLFKKYPDYKDHKDVSIQAIKIHFFREVEELTTALEGMDPQEIINEIVDCSNILDMLFDKFMEFKTQMKTMDRLTDSMK